MIELKIEVKEIEELIIEKVKEKYGEEWVFSKWVHYLEPDGIIFVSRIFVSKSR